MHFFSRQRDESVVIGDNVRITVIDIREDRVQIGISVPEGLCVERLEVYEALQREAFRRRSLRDD